MANIVSNTGTKVINAFTSRGKSIIATNAAKATQSLAQARVTNNIFSNEGTLKSLGKAIDNHITNDVMKAKGGTQAIRGALQGSSEIADIAKTTGYSEDQILDSVSDNFSKIKKSFTRNTKTGETIPDYAGIKKDLDMNNTLKRLTEDTEMYDRLDSGTGDLGDQIFGAVGSRERIADFFKATDMGAGTEANLTGRRLWGERAKRAATVGLAVNGAADAIGLVSGRRGITSNENGERDIIGFPFI